MNPDVPNLLVVEAPLQLEHDSSLEQLVARQLGHLEAVVVRAHQHAASLLRINAHEAAVRAEQAIGGDERRAGKDERRVLLRVSVRVRVRVGVRARVRVRV